MHYANQFSEMCIEKILPIGKNKNNKKLKRCLRNKLKQFKALKL